MADELRSPLAELLEAQRGFFALKAGTELTEDISSAVGSANGFRSLAVLAGTYAANVSSTALMVANAGLEPPTI